MADFSIFNGYNVKDAESRRQIEELRESMGDIPGTLENSLEDINTAIQDEVNARQTAVNDLNTAIQNEANTRAEEINAVLNAPKISAANQNLRYYVDGVNGNDENDGLSAGTAFKTIAKWLSLINDKGLTEIRCYIQSAGVYEVPYSTFNGVSMHITGNASGIILKLSSNTAFYHGHYNLDNLEFECQDDNTHFEGCSVAISSVKFSKYISFISGFVGINTLTCPKVLLRGINGQINHINITGTAANQVAIAADMGSNLRIFGNQTFAALEEPGGSSKMIELKACTVVYAPSAITGAQTYAIGLWQYGSFVVMDQATITKLTNVATTGYTGSTCGLTVNGLNHIGTAYT